MSGARDWRRIAGFRVVMSWPQAGYAPPPSKLVSLRARVAGLAGVLLIIAGAATIGVAIAAQVHAPQPSLTAAGILGPFGGQAHAPLRRSLPVSVDIPAIGVHSKLLHLGVNPDGTIRVPSLNTRADEETIYGAAGFPALRLITCGGTFDYTTRSYLSSTVVFASLTSARQAASA